MPRVLRTLLLLLPLYFNLPVLSSAPGSDIQANQVTSKGYGSSKPIAPNTNALNMAKNRRVEFVVLNKDVLKKESEKRKMLQK